MLPGGLVGVAGLPEFGGERRGFLGESKSLAVMRVCQMNASCARAMRDTTSQK